MILQSKILAKEQQKQVNRLSLQSIVGKGYAEYWHCKCRYRVCKGSRASKKSKTTALWIIANMMKYDKANTLVIRKTYRTLKDSCFAELKWAIHRLQVDEFWEIKESPLEITSITVEVGVLCWLWIEEAYEITKESDFDIIDESIRRRSSRRTI